MLEKKFENLVTAMHLLSLIVMMKDSPFGKDGNKREMEHVILIEKMILLLRLFLRVILIKITEPLRLLILKLKKRVGRSKALLKILYREQTAQRSQIILRGQRPSN